MARRITVLILVAALAGAFAAPVEAKKKAKPVVATYYISWFGDCTGSGYLSVEPAPNPDACPLFFPGLGDTYSFPGAGGLPLALDSSKPITVDFELGQVVSAAAEFQAILSGTVDGESVEIGSASQTIMAGTPGGYQLHFDLEPDASLDKKSISALDLTIRWASGVTYSSMVLEEGTATMVVNAFKK